MERTEKDKMLAGEPYLASDPQLVAERMACRKRSHRFNHSLIGTDESTQALHELLPEYQEEIYIEPPFYCDYGTNIRLGKNFYANFNCTILDVNIVTIGDNVMLAPNVQIYTAGHPLEAKQRVDEGVEFGLPISIGNNVWVGGGAIICPGVTIGDNTVIGAGSVVTKDIPENVLAAGNPCRIIKPIDK